MYCIGICQSVSRKLVRETYGTGGTVVALRVNTNFINSSNSDRVSSASSRLFAMSCALYVSVYTTMSFVDKLDEESIPELKAHVSIHS